MDDVYPILSLEWKTPRVFELTVERNGLKFVSGDSVALFSADGKESRPYSISSGVSEPVLRFLIQRMPNGHVSDYISNLTSGNTIRISQPFGWFRPGDNIDGNPYIFIATGTGIAPFMSYLRGYPHKPPQLLMYGIKKLEDAIDLEYMQSSCKVQVAISRESVPPYSHGRVTDLLPTISLDSKPHFYLCGLDAMIDEVSGWLEAAGVDFTHIHREVFFYASP